eukprot:CAMPEP_0173436156 /NCGR_PEP_ID=MMETSP1357-20121228/15790_1 /TAXON_ID=77926 /ORGANISM="Hemiselmis rufescens, Strain PCC563" /LENGTH=350 /DNA_ID=CAMNT_0014401215 /DNA_START=109 /DNA_END=1161 /DNA_ORIENTATION=-
MKPAAVGRVSKGTIFGVQMGGSAPVAAATAVTAATAVEEDELVDLLERANSVYAALQNEYKTNGVYNSEYGSKNDFIAAKKLLLAGAGHFEVQDAVLMAAGTNEGQLAEVLLQSVPPEVRFVGFEIQERAFGIVVQRLSKYPNAKVHRAGLGEVRAEMPVTGAFSGSGLFTLTKGNRFHGTAMGAVSASNVSVHPISEWAHQNGVQRVLYLVLDVEGSEPKAIRGMRLRREENRRRFAVFQYELGGTWAMRDPRHMADKWDQLRAAQHLEGLGYVLFLIGAHGWLRLPSAFFDITAGGQHMLDEGYGKFVQGNVLCIHSEYAPLWIRKLVFGSAAQIGDRLRASVQVALK